MALHVHGDASGLVVTPINGRLDTSTIGGRITLQDYRAPRIDFSLSVDQIDLDRYGTLEPGPAGPGDNVISRLSKDGLRELGISVNGEVKVGVLIASQDRDEHYQTTVRSGR